MMQGAGEEFAVKRGGSRYGARGFSGDVWRSEALQPHGGHRPGEHPVGALAGVPFPVGKARLELGRVGEQPMVVVAHRSDVCIDDLGEQVLDGCCGGMESVTILRMCSVMTCGSDMSVMVLSYDLLILRPSRPGSVAVGSAMSARGSCSTPGR
jgi:hypothetical protein